MSARPMRAVNGREQLRGLTAGLTGEELRMLARQLRQDALWLEAVAIMASRPPTLPATAQEREQAN